MVSAVQAKPGAEESLRWDIIPFRRIGCRISGNAARHLRKFAQILAGTSLAIGPANSPSKGPTMFGTYLMAFSAMAFAAASALALFRAVDRFDPPEVRESAAQALPPIAA
jgi:hypothetical protein